MLATPPPLNQTSSNPSEYLTAERARRPSAASLSDDASSISSTSTSQAAIGADWGETQIGQLVTKDKLVFVDAETPVEKAFETLDKYQFTSLPVKDEKSKIHELQQQQGITAVAGGVWYMFDYADLNAYLLLVLGRIEPNDYSTSKKVQHYVELARSGKPVPVQFVAQLGVTDPFVVVPSNTFLSSAAEILGNGVHRIAISDSKDPNVIVGILSQRRMVRYIWENGRRFRSLEPLFQTPLNELNIGTASGIFTVNGDDMVLEALLLMHTEGISSVAVVDSQNNLLGNISIVDVRLLTKASQSSLLRQTCKHFLSVILSNRGLADGQDAFPVFYVTPNTTFGRTIAKMVATNAHRLWVVQAPKPNPLVDSTALPTPQPPTSPTQGVIDQKLIGVVSLTDVLSLLARHAGKSQIDPTRARRQRRSSSSSVTRRSISITRDR